jgi:hypothetical protein
MTVEPSHSLVMRILRCLLVRDVVSACIDTKVQSGRWGREDGVVSVQESVWRGKSTVGG